MMTIAFVLLGLIPDSFAAKTQVCDGRYKSQECQYTLWINDCKNQVKLDWTALKIPGTKSWQNSHRNWCTVTFVSSDAPAVEKKLKPSVCDNIFSFITPAKKGFPEIEWQDTPCTHLTGKDAVLYFKEVSERESYYAVRLAEARGCKLEAQLEPKPKAKNRQVYRAAKRSFDLRCPVLTDRSFAWLKQFATRVGVRLVIQNDLR